MKQVFYVPERGDIVWVSLPPDDPKGRAGRRPAFVLSPRSYNARVGLALVCPITTRLTGYPFEVPLPADLPLAGVILADQAVSIDWRARRAERIRSLPSPVVEEVLGKLRALTG